MSATAVKISEKLAREARTCARASDRSMAGQIEHWATIGRHIETVVPEPTLRRLKQDKSATTFEFDSPEQRARVMEVLREIRDSLPQEEIVQKIAAENPVRYSAHPSDPKKLVRVGQSGEREVGHLEGRAFVPD